MFCYKDWCLCLLQAKRNCSTDERNSQTAVRLFSSAANGFLEVCSALCDCRLALLLNLLASGVEVESDLAV